MATKKKTVKAEKRNNRVVPGKKGLIPDSYRISRSKSFKQELDANGDVIPG